MIAEAGLALDQGNRERAEQVWLTSPIGGMRR
jgi:hypothetical protein